MPDRMAAKHILTDAHDAREHNIIVNPAPINSEIQAAETTRRHLLTPGTRRCDNEREPDGQVCTATLTFALGNVQAQCPACGAWTGRLAPGHERDVMPSDS
jgi:hypothetical protein